MFKNKKLVSALLLTTFVAASVRPRHSLLAQPSLLRFRDMTGTAAPCRFRIRIGRKPCTSRSVIARTERIGPAGLAGPIFICCALRLKAGNCRRNRDRSSAFR